MHIEKDLFDNDIPNMYCSQSIMVFFENTKDAIKARKLHKGLGDRNVKRLNLTFGCFFYKNESDEYLVQFINDRINKFFENTNKITKHYSAYKFDVEHFKNDYTKI